MAQSRSGAAFHRLTAAIPGIALCLTITLVSLGIQNVEERALAHPYVEALVIAILLGMAVRSFWRPSERWLVGIAFSPLGTAVLATNEAVYDVDLGVEGLNIF